MIGINMLRYISVLCTLILLVIADSNAFAQTELPNIHILTTGGTIASGGAEMKTGQDLVNIIPGIDKVANITIEDLFRVGSSKMTPEMWIKLIERINYLFSQPDGPDGIVITHGTDTMEETAFFLHLTNNDSRPVVITGSMRPSTAVSADGPANLKNAVRVAAFDNSRDRGVMVVLNDEIHSAGFIQKVNTSRLNAFASPQKGMIGFAYSDKIVYYSQPEKIGRNAGHFSKESSDQLPRVDIVYTYAGADGTLLKASVNAGAKGVVIASVGNGNLSSGQQTAVLEALENGIFIVLSSRTGSGRVFGENRGNNAALNRRIRAEDLSPPQARILLMLALAESQDVETIKKRFLFY